MQTLGTAYRVDEETARNAFADGRSVLVRETGTLETVPVTAITTTHSWRNTTWPMLRELVETWRNRHPEQTYYVIEWGN